MRYLIPSLLLLACTGKTETKTAIFIELTDGSSTAEGSESSTLANYARHYGFTLIRKAVALLTTYGPLRRRALEYGVGISSSFGDYVIDDSDLELGMGILCNWSGIVPVIELKDLPTTQDPFCFEPLAFREIVV